MLYFRMWSTVVVVVLTPVTYLGTYSDLGLPSIVSTLTAFVSAILVIVNSLLYKVRKPFVIKIPVPRRFLIKRINYKTAWLDGAESLYFFDNSMGKEDKLMEIIARAATAQFFLHSLFILVGVERARRLFPTVPLSQVVIGKLRVIIFSKMTSVGYKHFFS